MKPIQPLTHHWQQTGACRLGDSRDIVCWGRSIADASASRVYVVCADGHIEEVFTGRGLFIDVTSTRAGPLIHVAVDEQVIGYARKAGLWEPVMHRAESIIGLATLSTGHLAVMPAERNWLELWSTEESLKTVAICYMPVSVKCISTTANAIVLGTQDGRHVLVTLYHHGRPKR